MRAERLKPLGEIAGSQEVGQVLAKLHIVAIVPSANKRLSNFIFQPANPTSRWPDEVEFSQPNWSSVRASSFQDGLYLKMAEF
jgi:hypothetical protein